MRREGKLLVPLGYIPPTRFPNLLESSEERLISDVKAAKRLAAVRRCVASAWVRRGADPRMACASPVLRRHNAPLASPVS